MKKMMKMRKRAGVVLLMAVLCVTAAGCTAKKEAITSERFEEIMDENGYELLDVTSDFPEGTVERAILAQYSGEESYELQFLEFHSKDQAESLFEQHRDTFEAYSDAKSNVSVNIGNYHYYEQTDIGGDGYFYVLSQVDHTLLFGVVDKKCKDDVKDIMDKLGYGN